MQRRWWEEVHSSVEADKSQHVLRLEHCALSPGRITGSEQKSCIDMLIHCAPVKKSRPEEFFKIIAVSHSFMRCSFFITPRSGSDLSHLTVCATMFTCGQRLLNSLVNSKNAWTTRKHFVAQILEHNQWLIGVRMYLFCCLKNSNYYWSKWNGHQLLWWQVNDQLIVFGNVYASLSVRYTEFHA